MGISSNLWAIKSLGSTFPPTIEAKPMSLENKVAYKGYEQRISIENNQSVVGRLGSSS